MIRKIEENRLNSFQIPVGKDQFPIFHVKPINPSDTLIIFVPGLNGNGNMIYYWDYPLFDNAHFASYDPRSQASNTAKPSKNYRKYVDDLYKIINNLKKQLNVKKIFLIAESWGSSLSFLLTKKYKNVVDGLFCWNMPHTIHDTNKVKGSEKNKRNLLVVSTYLFNVNTYDTQPFTEGLINNPVILRAIKMSKKLKLSNRVIISSWLSFKKSWRYLAKNFNKLNFRYVQSGGDIVGNFKMVEKLAKKSDKFIMYEKGCHLLSFDIEMADKLFADIGHFIDTK